MRRGLLTGGGPLGREAERALGDVLGAAPLLFTSCTAALEAAVRLSGVGPGDDVVCPSFTFVSTANAVVLAGARPVLADIDPDTLNLDPDAVEPLITPRTKAIIVVHYGGRACDMTRFVELSRRYGLRLIEDAAHALGGRWQGRPLGTIGDFGCFSFHGTKDVVCGEGGALVCQDASDRRRAELLREKGTNRAQFLRGEIDRYTWVDEGSSWVASDVLAAILRVQVEKLPQVLARKRALAAALSQRLQPVADRLTLPAEWPGIESTWHLYPVLVAADRRDAVIEALRAEGIGATFHYVPLHSSPFALAHLADGVRPLPHTDRVAASLIRLPLFASMDDADLDDVVRATLKVTGRLLSQRAPAR